MAKPIKRSGGSPQRPKSGGLPRTQKKTIDLLAGSIAGIMKSRVSKPIILAQPTRMFRREIKAKRLPILGLRSQTETKENLKRRRQNLAQLQRNINFRNTKPEAPHYICRRRAKRRATLFIRGIAGKNKRNSPGAGGKYRRDSTSELTCKRRK